MYILKSKFTEFLNRLVVYITVCCVAFTINIGKYKRNLSKIKKLEKMSLNVHVFNLALP